MLYSAINCWLELYTCLMLLNAVVVSWTKLAASSTAHWASAHSHLSDKVTSARITIWPVCFIPLLLLFSIRGYKCLDVLRHIMGKDVACFGSGLDLNNR